ncbi:hypothetical protein Anapl_09653, partial [Anas platyrhynchos]
VLSTKSSPGRCQQAVLEPCNIPEGSILQQQTAT